MPIPTGDADAFADALAFAEPVGSGVGVDAGSAYTTNESDFFASSFITRCVGTKRISIDGTGPRGVATAVGVVLTVGVGAGAPGGRGVGEPLGVGVGVGDGVGVGLGVDVAFAPPDGVGVGVALIACAIFFVHLFSLAGS